MKVKDIMDALPVKLLTPEAPLDGEVAGGYASDLLSNVMGQAQPGMVWVTMQGHQNVAAVASLIGVAAVIVAGDSPVAEDTLSKAALNEVVIFSTELSAFETIGRLYEMGVGK